jgi:hypothetical protein
LQTKDSVGKAKLIILFCFFLFQAEGKRVVASKDEFLVPYHIDNGLFLLLTPFPSPSLLVRLSNGESVDTDGLPADSVLVLMGRGLTEWLLQNEDRTEFFPVPHAVPTLAGSRTLHRSVFARMKVAPPNAVPKTTKGKTALLKFSDIFFETVSAKRSGPSEDLCAGSVSEDVHLHHWKQRSTPLSAIPFLKVMKNKFYRCKQSLKD